MWVCYQYDVDEKDWVELGGVEAAQDCFGDELYAFMIEMGWVNDMDNYDVEGDSDVVVVMGKTEEDGEFKWEWEYDA
jgi:hypothetical protein